MSRATQRRPRPSATTAKPQSFSALLLLACLLPLLSSAVLLCIPDCTVDLSESFLEPPFPVHHSAVTVPEWPDYTDPTERCVFLGSGGGLRPPHPPRMFMISSFKFFKFQAFSDFKLHVKSLTRVGAQVDCQDASRPTPRIDYAFRGVPRDTTCTQFTFVSPCQ